jgi:hypothetical protein
MRRSLLAAVAVLAVGLVLAARSSTVAAQDQDDIPIPVTGMTDGPGPTGAASIDVRFEGTFNLRRFSAREGRVYAVGTLSGDFAGVGAIADEPVRVTVQRVETSCEYFRLVLGPVNVDLPDAEGDLRPLDMNELYMAFNADDGDGIVRPLLCAVADAIGDQDLDLNADDLPISAERLARMLNQVVRFLT